MMQPCCPVCGNRTLLEFYEPAGAALCTRCGHILRWFRERFALDRIPLGTKLTDLGLDSLDIVELVMELEEEYGVAIPDEIAERITTIEEAIYHLELLQTEKLSREDGIPIPDEIAERIRTIEAINHLERLGTEKPSREESEQSLTSDN